MLIPALSFLWTALSPLSAGQNPEHLVLAVGEQRLVEWPGLASYTRGDPSHLDVLSSQASLLIRTKKPGLSEVRIWDHEDGSPHSLWIESRAYTRPWLWIELSRGLSGLREAQVLFLGEAVSLRGEVHSVPELRRIRDLTRTFPERVTDETRLSIDLQTQGVKALKNWILGLGRSTSLRVRATDGCVVFYGSAQGPSDQRYLEKRAVSLFPGVTLALESLADAHPTLLFRVFLLELKRTAARSLGLQWPALQEGAFRLTSSGLQSLLQLEVALRELESRGLARLLSRPELVVRTPGQAELFAGGELPIQMKTQYYSSVSWKTFGLLLKLKTLEATSERVRLELQTEVSHLDANLALHDIPGLQANRLKTEVDARLGEPLFLSGLLQEGTRRSAQGLPWLRSIPVLGLLFGSEDYLHEQSELVAILVPDERLPRLRERVVQGPPPRQWLDPGEVELLKKSPRFPWNVFEEVPPT